MPVVGCRLSGIKNNCSKIAPMGVTSFLGLAEALRRQINPRKIGQTAGQHFLTKQGLCSYKFYNPINYVQLTICEKN